MRKNRLVMMQKSISYGSLTNLCAGRICANFCGGKMRYWCTGRGVLSGAKVAQCPGRRKVPTMSQVLSWIQYICSRKTLGSNMGGAKLVSSPGLHARGTSNLGTPLCAGVAEELFCQHLY